MQEPTEDRDVRAADGGQGHEMAVLHVQDAPDRPWWRTLKAGDDFYRDAGEWRHLCRLRDRRHNVYAEQIVDAAGNLVVDVIEPWSTHDIRKHPHWKPRRRTGY